jgi:hypothetical protein
VFFFVWVFGENNYAMHAHLKRESVCVCVCEREMEREREREKTKIEEKRKRFLSEKIEYSAYIVSFCNSQRILVLLR